MSWYFSIKKIQKLIAKKQIVDCWGLALRLKKCMSCMWGEGIIAYNHTSNSYNVKTLE